MEQASSDGLLIPESGQVESGNADAEYDLLQASVHKRPRGEPSGDQDVPPAADSAVPEWPQPRCCATHALELKALEASASRKPDVLTPEEVAELARLRAASQGDAWLVLVGGEYGGMMRPDAKGQRPGPYFAGHCSLNWIGIAYERLLPYFGRDRIIVIAQLKESLDWLEAAAVDEASAERLAGKASLLSMLRSKLAETQEACAKLIEDGGAHYDGAAVNAATVLRVIRGDSAAGGRVVPPTGVRSMMLVMVSHGHCHPAGPGSRHHEWYMHMPYPVSPEDQGLYDSVSTCGFAVTDDQPDWDWGAPKHRWKLYGQMLFMAYHEVLQRAPQRRLVLFHQFCLSGGISDFMRKRSYQAHCGTQRWPVFSIATAGRFEPALGNFVGIWTQEIQDALAKGGAATLQDVFALADQRYWSACPELRKMNLEIQMASTHGDMLPPDDAPSSVGTISFEAGYDGALEILMKDLPCAQIVNSVPQERSSARS